MFNSESQRPSPPAFRTSTPHATPASIGPTAMTRSRTIPAISSLGPGPLLSVAAPSYLTYLTEELDHVEAYQLYTEHKFRTPRRSPFSRSGPNEEETGGKQSGKDAKRRSSSLEHVSNRRDSLAPPNGNQANRSGGQGSSLSTSSSSTFSNIDESGQQARGRGTLARSNNDLGIPTFRRYVGALAAAIGFLSYGYHLGELNNVTGLLTCQSGTATPLAQGYLIPTLQLPSCIPMSTFAISAANALIPISGAFGAVFGGYLSQRVGRIKTLVFFAAIGVVSPIFMTLAADRIAFLIGRSLAGLAAGGHAASVPIYISEMAHPRRRGLFGVFSPVALSLGLALASLTGFYWSKTSPDWRNIFGVAVFPPLLQAVLLLTVCIESPQWYVSVKYGARARSRSLLALKAVKPEPPPPPPMEISRPIRLGAAGSLAKLLSDSSNNLMPIKAQIVVSSAESDSPTKLDPPSSPHAGTQVDHGTSLHVGPLKEPEPPRPVTLRKFVTEKEYRHVALILAFAHSASQLSGVNVYFVYSVSILSNVMTFDQANLFYLVFAFSNIFLSALPGYLSERFGRRKLLLLSMMGMAMSAVILTLSVYFQLPALSMAMFILAITMFQCGLASVPLILVCELVEPKAVGAASSLAQVVSTCASTVALFAFPLALETLGALTFLLFTSCLIVAGAGLWWLLPETMGKSLEEVLAELKNSPTP